MEKKKRGRPKRTMNAFDGRVQIRLTKQDVDALDELSKKLNISKSSLARLAIQKLIDGEILPWR